MGQSQPINRKAVLVIEDEPVLRLYLLDLVEEAGFDPVEAASADDALRILEQRPDIRIVYMDLDMPHGVRGIEVAAAIRSRWPPIEIILTAAFLTRDDVALPERAEFYPKPIQRDQLIGTMRRLTRQLEI